MDAAREFPDLIEPTLATAATLDYAVVLATDTAGVPIDPLGARGAIDDALAAAFDDALRFMRALVRRDPSAARRFCEKHGVDGGMVATLRALERRPGLQDPERAFALIALANDVAT